MPGMVKHRLLEESRISICIIEVLTFQIPTNYRQSIFEDDDDDGVMV